MRKYEIRPDRPASDSFAPKRNSPSENDVSAAAFAYDMVSVNSNNELPLSQSFILFLFEAAR